ncbi:MAG: C-GCAxxG-C-C family protein [Oscillospiraceae bacterium]|nr:C-GCAxxG-C-C family protein [Oscillospiraceae bacterium]
MNILKFLKKPRHTARRLFPQKNLSDAEYIAEYYNNYNEDAWLNNMQERKIVMITKEETARGLFSMGYNCAQAVLGALCEENGLDIKAALKLASGFGGGMRYGEVCGAVSGAVMAVGLKCGFYAEKDFEQKGFCNKKSFEFMEKFKEKNGSVLCRDLLGADIRSPEDHNKPEIQALHKTVCPELVASAVLILEKMEF